MWINTMLTESLIEAKIVPVYNLNGLTYQKGIVIFHPAKTIYFYPAKGGLRFVRNKKYSIRRLLRWALRGCKVVIQGAEHMSNIYPIVYLTKDDLEKMFRKLWNKEKEKLINEIYEINTRKCS